MSDNRKKILILISIVCFLIITIKSRNYDESYSKYEQIVGKENVYKSKEEKAITITNCDCQRDIVTYPSLFNVKTPSNQTTCSNHAHRRGENQKVIAFSFYEQSNELYKKRKKTGKIKKNKFIKGIKINIDKIKDLYKGINLYKYESIVCLSSQILKWLHCVQVSNALGVRSIAAA